MSKPRYFRQFPDIRYAMKANKAGKVSGVEIKDYFNLLVMRNDVFRKETLYSPYTIKNGQRPDQISYEYYGDEQFYWVILQVNEITDYWNQWPLSENELTEFVIEKYGGYVGAEQIKQYQTVETYDKANPPNLVLKGGLVVPEDFIFYYPASPDSEVTLSTRPSAISNYEYERGMNAAKSQIFLLDKKYIWEYETEVRNYAKNLKPGQSFVDLS